MLTTLCELKVQDGKVFCTVCNEEHTITTKEHLGHDITSLPMRHVLYVAFICTQCNELIIDEEQ